MKKMGRPRRATTTPIVRFQTNLDGPTHALFTEVQEALGAESLTAALRRMVKLTKWFLDQQKHGFTVLVEKDGRTREIDLIL